METFQISDLYGQIRHDLLQCKVEAFFTKIGLKILISLVEVKILPIYVG